MAPVVFSYGRIHGVGCEYLPDKSFFNFRLTANFLPSWSVVH